MNEYKPNILITSDNISYLERFDWKEINEYKKNNKLKIGLTANLPEEGDSPLLERLDWAKKIILIFITTIHPMTIRRKEKTLISLFLITDLKF